MTSTLHSPHPVAVDRATDRRSEQRDQMAMHPLVVDADVVTTRRGPRLLDRHGRLWQLPVLPEAVLAALNQSDGTRSRAALRAELRPTDRALWDELLAEFAHHGLSTPPVDEVRIALVGSSTVATACARALLDGTAVSLQLFDPSPPDPGCHRVRGHHTGAGALRATLLRERLPVDRVSVAGHWSELGTDSDIDWVVVAEPTIESDRAVASHLTAVGLPHLVVAGHRDHAQVGPLVVPGRTACLGCIDRHRAAVDPEWPTVAARLSRRRSAPRAGVTRWAAALVQTWLTTRPRTDASTRSALVHTLTFGAGLPREANWPPHPGCPCQAGPL